ncbi:MAG: hypothetical protein H6737_02220 [Alphaproteobacteria bacterium]|nr:hypothetical protein [Alphaproteobacteria bacterium]
MPRILCAGATLDLGTADFVAQGGQASVYARGGFAYKLFTDPGHAPGPAKLAALRALASHGLVAPDAEVCDEAGQRVGFRMPFLDGWHPLVRLFPRAYRQRHGLDAAAIGARVLELRGLVAHAHAHQALVVDLNEVNVLVAPDHVRLALIDVDSWQLPGFPATALAESVRDRHTAGFSETTDWFAYAIVTFQLFTGIHPFRGQHPTAKTLDARMTANLSVFHPEVVVPPMVDLDALPPTWRDWYEALFVYTERTPPPDDLTAPAPRAPRALPGASVEVQPLFALPDPILGTASWDGRTWAWTRAGLYEGRRRLGPPPPAGALPFRAPDGIAFAVQVSDRNRALPMSAIHHDNGEANFAGLHLWLADGTPVATDLRATSLSAHRGMLHGLAGNALVELTLQRLAGTPVLTARTAATVAPHATGIFRGVAVTSILGATWVSRLGPGTCHQERVPALEGEQVVDAVHAAGVTVLVTRGASGFTRHVLGPDGLTSAPTALPTAELLVLPTGVAIVPTETGLELFLAAHPTRGARAVTVDLPEVLLDLGGRPGFARDDTLFAVTLKR